MKKIISLILALVMIMSVAVVGFSAMAADDENVAVVEVTEENTTEEEVEEHRNFYQIIWDMMLEFYGLLKYIFYDVFLGKAP